MTTTIESPAARRPVGGSARAGTDRFARVGDLAKFTAAVALLAILSDAAVGHALLWENDPYWTYWITKTFLIATVFGLGTAWLGTGIARGAVLTAVHTLILTVYYWSLSPIGLPSHPEWLDLQHTWVTGVPVHFGVIYLGYLAALWLWRRRPAEGDEDEDRSVAGDANRAVAVGTGIVVVGGLLEAVAIGEFPGVTWFVVRVLITVPFVLAWLAAAGRDRAAAVGGGITLALMLATYSHFLGPVGLPDTDLRILAQDPPPATVHWLSYRDEWLVAFPLTLFVAVAALLADSAWHRGRWSPIRIGGRALLVTVIAVVGIAGLGAVVAVEGGPDDQRATVTSDGEPQVERGEFFRGTLVPAAGELRLVAHERNPRVTPLPPHDGVDLDAAITHPDGTRYEITATEPMVDDPQGRFGTWWGVGLDKWHHGRSGIGTSLLPATRSEVAAFALGEVRADGEVVARGVPIHVMTMDNGGVELDVGDPQSPVPGLPDGHIRAVWDDRHGDSPEGHERSHNALGSAVLAALIALAVAAIRSEQAAERR
ncbi:MAG: hypothetical protein M3357_11715 [Actinomycetota bacterium]|nr:hypothetical protein [Actinomycetota bacterium]